MSNNIQEYVDLDALAIWEQKLTSINSFCLGYLNEFENLSLELSSVWSGNAASSFDENFKKQLETAKIHHNELTDVNKFIETLAAIVKNE